MEYAENGDLFNFLNKKGALEEKTACKFFVQTALALNYIHHFKMIHRDVKPENILLDKNLNAKLCDFGWSAEYDENTRRQTVCGTYEYMAPEILFKKQQDTGIDVWALGILLYELLHNKAPFSGRSLVEVSKKIASKSIEFSSKVPQDAKDLVISILKLNPKERPTIPQLLKSAFVQRTYGQIDESLYNLPEARDSQKSSTSSNLHSSNNQVTTSSSSQTPSARHVPQINFAQYSNHVGTSNLQISAPGGSSSSNMPTPMALSNKRPPMAPQQSVQTSQTPSSHNANTHKFFNNQPFHTPQSSSQSPMIHFNLGRPPMSLYQHANGIIKSSFDRLPDAGTPFSRSLTDQYQPRDGYTAKMPDCGRPQEKYYIQPARDASQDGKQGQGISYFVFNKENKDGASNHEKHQSSHNLHQYTQKNVSFVQEKSVLQPVDKNTANRSPQCQSDDMSLKAGQTAKLNSLRLKRVVCDQTFARPPQAVDQTARYVTGQPAVKHIHEGQAAGSSNGGQHDGREQPNSYRFLTKQNSMDIDRSQVYEQPPVQQFYRPLAHQLTG